MSRYFIEITGPGLDRHDDTGPEYRDLSEAYRSAMGMMYSAAEKLVGEAAEAPYTLTLCDPKCSVPHRATLTLTQEDGSSVVTAVR